MQMLIPAGAAVTVLGLIGLVWCIIRVARARKSGLDDDGLRALMQSLVALNLGALCLSAIGLMLVVMGILFG